MQIVIDIPDEQIEKSLAESKYIHENEGEKGSVNIVLLYTNKKLEFMDISRKTDFYSLTDKYTVLPKGHGDLVDRNDLLANSYVIDDYAGNEVNIVDRMTVEMADAIIEADKEIEKRKPCINYEDGCEEWAGCPCVHYKAESEDKK